MTHECSTKREESRVTDPVEARVRDREVQISAPTSRDFLFRYRRINPELLETMRSKRAQRTNGNMLYLRPPALARMNLFPVLGDRLIGFRRVCIASILGFEQSLQRL
jgi:hypothetical protein